MKKIKKLLAKENMKWASILIETLLGLAALLTLTVAFLLTFVLLSFVLVMYAMFAAVLAIRQVVASGVEITKSWWKN